MQPPQYYQQEADYLVVPDPPPKQNGQLILLSIQKQVIEMEDKLKEQKKKLRDVLDEQKAALDDDFVADCKVLDAKHQRLLEIYASKLLEVSTVPSPPEPKSWFSWLASKMLQ